MMALSILVFFPLLLLLGVVVLIVSLVSKRNEGKTESFPRTIRLVYMYAVIIVSLFLTVSGAIFAWNNAMSLALPEPSHYSTNAELEQQNQRNRALQGLYTSLATVAVGATVFAYHSRKVKKQINCNILVIKT